MKKIDKKGISEWNLYKAGVAIIVALSLILPGTTAIASIGTIYVDDDADPGWYDATHVRTIQEGIDNATAGDTVFVYGGTYYENVVVNKIVDLIGEDEDITTIDGGGS